MEDLCGTAMEDGTDLTDSCARNFYCSLPRQSATGTRTASTKSERISRRDGDPLLMYTDASK